MENNKVCTSRGEVISVGELRIFSSDDFPYKIPILSFVVIKEADNVFASTCIQLHIDGDGSSAEKALSDMKDNVEEFLLINFKGNSKDTITWENLEEFFRLTEGSVELWDAYKKGQEYFSRCVENTNSSEMIEETESNRTKESKTMASRGFSILDIAQ